MTFVLPFPINGSLSLGILTLGDIIFILSCEIRELDGDRAKVAIASEEIRSEMNTTVRIERRSSLIQHSHGFAVLRSFCP